MATAVRRITVSTDVEQKILTGVIVNTDFCRKVLPILEPYHIEILHVRRILVWVMDYYDVHKEAPGQHIQDIYLTEQQKLKPEEGQLIQEYLSNLSRTYELETQVNWEFQYDRIRAYCRQKSLQVIAQKITTAAESGKVDQAEEMIREYRNVSKKTSEWYDPLNPEVVKASLKEKERGLFKFKGALGELFGWIHRGWTIALMGPPKRGKTSWFVEFAIQIIMLFRLRVAFVSLEMSQTDMEIKFLRAVSASPDNPGEYRIPVWDCLKNQDGTCQLEQRASSVQLMDEGAPIPESAASGQYVPCTHCKDTAGWDEHYSPSSWYTSIAKTQTIYGEGESTARKLANFLGHNTIRFRCYPRFSVTLDEIESDLDDLIYNEGFIPDVVILDYLDIVNMGASKEQGRDRYDEVWKQFTRMSGEKKWVGITGTQGNKKSITSQSTQQEHITEDMRKLAHVDMLIGLSQARFSGRSEKSLGRMRLGLLLFRHGETPDDEVIVLQQQKLGQVCLDSYARSVNRRRRHETEEHQP
jgi:hypothetical protein